MTTFQKTRAAAVMAALMVVAAAAKPGGTAVELGVPGRSNANLSIAASGQFVAMAWGAATDNGATDVYVAISSDAGRTFGRPTRVNTAATQASVSGEQPPRVALVPRSGQNPSLVVVWTAKAPQGTQLLSARSDDGGKSFARPTAVPGATAAGNRGWHATATDKDGRVVAIWLDHRELGGGGTGTEAHDHAAHKMPQADGAERAQRSKLFFARLDSADSTRALTGGVCYCCKTAIATGPDGSIYAAWRHVYPGNIRDIAFTVSRDGGRTFGAPIRVSEDRWVLDGCPENGPAIAVDGSGRIHIAWPTLVPGAPGRESTLELFYATSRDGRQFSPRQKIPTEGLPRHPQIVVGARGAVVVGWDEQVGGTRRVALARGTVDGKEMVRFARQVVSDDRPGAYPVLAVADDAIVTGWTSGPAGKTALRLERLAN
jgi:hypothetical protein